jgi:hypothetical protein
MRCAHAGIRVHVRIAPWTCTFSMEMDGGYGHTVDYYGKSVLGRIYSKVRNYVYIRLYETEFRLFSVPSEQNSYSFFCFAK